MAKKKISKNKGIDISNSDANTYIITHGGKKKSSGKKNGAKK